MPSARGLYRDGISLARYGAVDVARAGGYLNPWLEDKIQLTFKVPSMSILAIDPTVAAVSFDHPSRG